MATHKILEWDVFEYEHKPKSSDWSWIAGIIGISLAVLAVILGNLIFGVLLVIATITVILFAHKHPDVLHVEINNKGVRVNDEYFPYSTLDSYWVDDEGRYPYLILTSKEKTLIPHIKIPIHSDVDPDELKDLMLDYLDQEYKESSLIEEVSYHIGI